MLPEECVKHLKFVEAGLPEYYKEEIEALQTAVRVMERLQYDQFLIMFHQVMTNKGMGPLEMDLRKITTALLERITDDR